MINRRLAFLFLLFWIIIPVNLFAQDQLTQTIRGVIMDKLSKSPLPGATIALLGGDSTTGTFPAQYENALSGVFDLKLRTGNNEKFIFLVQTKINYYGST